jgi:chaperonin GroES
MDLKDRMTRYEVPDVDELPSVPTPYIHKVVVMPLDPVKKTAGGIILTDTSVEAAKWVQHLGVILAYGPDAFKDSSGKERYSPMPKKGDIVMYGQYAGTAFRKEFIDEVNLKVGDKKLLLVNDTEIVMNFEDDATGIRTDK